MRPNVDGGWARDLLQTAVWIGLALLAVVATVVGFAVHQITSDQNPEIEDWPLRGSLAGDEALLDRAEKVWRASGGPGAPDGGVDPLYAERSSSLAVNTVLVVLTGYTAEDRPVVAFVTGPSTDRLFLRAVDFPGERPLGVGFVAAAQDPADTPVPDGGSLAFALASPKVRAVLISTTTPGPRQDHPPGETYWRILPRGAGAWNSQITGMLSDEEQTWPAAGVHDSAATTTATVSRTTAKYQAAAGDLLMTQHRLFGVVKNASGEVDVDAATWAAHGEVRTGSGIPGVLTALPTGHLRFTPTGPGTITENDDVLFTSKVNPAVVVRVGLMFSRDGEWQVDRPGYPPYVANQEVQVVTPRGR